MQTGNIFIKFKEEVTEQEAEAIMSKLYINNDKAIDGMIANLFDNEKTYEDVKTLVKDFCTK